MRTKKPGRLALVLSAACLVALGLTPAHASNECRIGGVAALPHLEEQPLKPQNVCVFTADGGPHQYVNASAAAAFNLWQDTNNNNVIDSPDYYESFGGSSVGALNLRGGLTYFVHVPCWECFTIGRCVIVDHVAGPCAWGGKIYIR